MKRIMRFEFYRAFRSRGFHIALCAGIGIAVADILLFYQAFRQEISTKVFLQAWIGTDYQFVTNGLFYILLPVIAALPYAGSYYEDLKSGYLKNILLSTSRRSYYTAKAVVVFTMGAITVMIPLLIDMMVVMTIYPLRAPERLEFLTAGILDANLFSDLFAENGALYALAYIVFDGVYAGVLALFGICVAEHVESLFSTVVLPFVAYIIWSTVMLENYDGKFSLVEMLNPQQRIVSSGLQAVVIFAGLVIVAVTWMIKKGRRKNVL